MTAYTRQLVRYSATVAAAAASLTLTVAAGTYIANHMSLAGPGRSDTGAFPEPGGPSEPGAVTTETGDPRPMLFEVPRRPVVAQASVFRPVAPAPEPAAAPAPSSAPGLAGTVRLGTTYVGAHLAPGEPHTYALTVDTNIATTTATLLSESARQALGLAGGPSDVTALRTELDVARGIVTWQLTDPSLGVHTVRLSAPTETAPATAEYAPGPLEPAQATVGV
ncbi:hypothetical protein ACWEVD_12980 [Nocardia thailandica]